MGKNRPSMQETWPGNARARAPQPPSPRSGAAAEAAAASGPLTAAGESQPSKDSPAQAQPGGSRDREKECVWALWGSRHVGPGNAALFEEQGHGRCHSGQDLKTQPAWINQWALNPRAEAHVEARDAKGRGYSPGVPGLAGGLRKQEGLEEVLQKEQPCRHLDCRAQCPRPGGADAVGCEHSSAVLSSRGPCMLMPCGSMMASWPRTRAAPGGALAHPSSVAAAWSIQLCLSHEQFTSRQEWRGKSSGQAARGTRLCVKSAGCEQGACVPQKLQCWRRLPHQFRVIGPLVCRAALTRMTVATSGWTLERL